MNYELRIMNRKYIFHILKSLFPVFHFYLWSRFFHAPKNIGLNGNVQAVSNTLSQYFCLIKPTVAVPGRMKRNGDESSFVSW